ncbi:GNAT family N-acetyltransferase [Reinekea sp.]|jgi:GNAT superfamily N-acetyltransferase|uniref:GNAT family N-acetyltransferase n=1 Tax=Reinekea sp. TaxID=1970455 RepID=UPI003989C969
MNIDFTLSPSDQDVAVLLDGLRKFNAPAFPNRDTKAFGIFIRDVDNNVIGGLMGDMTFTSIFVKFLWLSESVRGIGLGEKLLKRLEIEAIELGVNNLCLDTYSFQAPKFYAKYGYREVGRFTDFPCKGVDQIYFQKKLAAS